MNLNAIIESFNGCSCGHTHSFDLKTYECSSGNVKRVGAILENAGFPKKVYVVSDEPAMNAAAGITESLTASGFDIKVKVYPSTRYAYMSVSDEIAADAALYDGILSIGTGSINDVCRYAAARTGKKFAIFATAPSMDGFASDSAPLIKDNFKISYPCRQPDAIIADSDILAAAPAELKSAGYGDIIAKYIAITDWKASHYCNTGEAYCENIVSFVRSAVDFVVAATDDILANSPSSAEKIMDALVMTGCSMQLAKNTRPASGSEHVISHFWEIHKLENGIWPDYHGKKVGLACTLVIPIYKSLLSVESIGNPGPENLNLPDILSHYGASCRDQVTAYNVPSICDSIDYVSLASHWDDIRESIKNDLPDTSALISLMKRAGCVTEISEAHISPEFAREALIYSPYMRRRVTLLRLWRHLGFPEI